MNFDDVSVLYFIAGLALGLLVGALVTAVWYLKRIAILSAEREGLRANLLSQDELVQEREKTLNAATQNLRVAFDELANQSLSSNSEAFLRLARENLGQFQTQANADLGTRTKAIDEMIRPIAEALTSTRKQLENVERERQQAYGAIQQHLQAVKGSHEQLQLETNRLVSALQRPDIGGQWGEITLRRLVELAGMVEHCDFVEQKHTATDSGSVRPDMVVKLPDRGEIIVDAKTPLDAYLAATQATDDAIRKKALQRHARNLRHRVKELASKEYWTQFKHSPEFVLMFIPGDQFLSAGISHDPSLLEDALKQRVILVTPSSLVALLKAVAYGWRQSVLTDNAEKIRDLAEELYKRLASFTGHIATLGNTLTRSIESYNKAVGSLERSVLPGARKFTKLGISEKKTLAAIEVIDKTARVIDTHRDPADTTPGPATDDSG